MECITPRAVVNLKSSEAVGTADPCQSQKKKSLLFNPGPKGLSLGLRFVHRTPQVLLKYSTSILVRKVRIRHALRPGFVHGANKRVAADVPTTRLPGGVNANSSAMLFLASAFLQNGPLHARVQFARL